MHVALSGIVEYIYDHYVSIINMHADLGYIGEYMIIM